MSAVLGSCAPGESRDPVVAVRACRCPAPARQAADHLVQQVVLGRLGQPDARDLLVTYASSCRPKRRSRLTALTTRQIASLLAEGLLGGTAAREHLTSISRRLKDVEAVTDDQPFKEGDFLDLAAAWERGSMPQRRAVLRLLFSSMELRHVGPRGGPRANPARILLTWAQDPSWLSLDVPRETLL